MTKLAIGSASPEVAGMPELPEVLTCSENPSHGRPLEKARHAGELGDEVPGKE